MWGGNDADVDAGRWVVFFVWLGTALHIRRIIGIVHDGASLIRPDLAPPWRAVFSPRTLSEKGPLTGRCLVVDFEGVVSPADAVALRFAGLGMVSVVVCRLELVEGFDRDFSR